MQGLGFGGLGFKGLGFRGILQERQERSKDYAENGIQYVLLGGVKGFDPIFWVVQA